MRILVADDDRDTVETQAIILRQLGYAVLTSTSGKDVMHLIEEHRPEVLLLDLAMPEMDGFTVATELQDNLDLRPKLLIAVTGFADEASRQKSKQAGFDFHLAKPVELSQLLAILQPVAEEKPGRR